MFIYQILIEFVLRQKFNLSQFPLNIKARINISMASFIENHNKDDQIFIMVGSRHCVKTSIHVTDSI